MAMSRQANETAKQGKQTERKSNMREILHCHQHAWLLGRPHCPLCTLSMILNVTHCGISMFLSTPFPVTELKTLFALTRASGDGEATKGPTDAESSSTRTTS